MFRHDFSTNLLSRPSGRVLAWFVGLGLALGVAVLGLGDSGQWAGRTAQGARLVAELGLSDLALFTEARYTRHPSLADYHAPFQDHPMALDHFPTGALIPPPAHLRTPHVSGD